RYVGLNTANGAVLDALGNLQTIDSQNGAIAYRHVWGGGWRSSLIYSAIEVDNDASLTGTGVTQRTNSFQANLLYSPTAKATFGVGLLNATRQLYSNTEGDMTRLIFTAKYAF
ncbi:MAG: porin, partial [Gammaproteobacteria bacterium]|nr:porin [Gammaproteobacteria bacterium]